MSGNGNDNNLRIAEKRSNAARKAWATRRANARRRDYQARAAKAWITRRAREAYGNEDQGTLTSRVLDNWS
jgi:hypothetical protein